MKRLVDVCVAALALLALSPFIAVISLLIWAQDRHNPLYTPYRVGVDGRLFRMVKLRTMVVNADTAGGSSTAANDRRITALGRFIRRFKIDELGQLWNVLVGDMSLVGPRPNLKEDTDRYTAEERALISVKPGITDFASIVFADEGEILKDKPDPDIAYNQLIRPWKSRLGIFYVEHRSLAVDLRLIALTAQGLVDRPAALAGVHKLLKRLGADEQLQRVALREQPLTACPPPGMSEIVTSLSV